MRGVELKCGQLLADGHEKYCTQMETELTKGQDKLMQIRGDDSMGNVEISLPKDRVKRTTVKKGLSDVELVPK